MHEAVCARAPRARGRRRSLVELDLALHDILEELLELLSASGIVQVAVYLADALGLQICHERVQLLACGASRLHSLQGLLVVPVQGVATIDGELEPRLGLRWVVLEHRRDDVSRRKHVVTENERLEHRVCWVRCAREPVAGEPLA